MPPEPTDPRDDLSRGQVNLARALTGRGPIPPGFDPSRLHVAAGSLVAKRASSAAKAWPAFVSSLGPAYAGLFAAYAATHPLPPGASSLEDLHRFARDLARRQTLPAPAARMLCLHVARRHLLSWAVDRTSGRCLVAFRIPFFRTFCLSVPVPRRPDNP